MKYDATPDEIEMLLAKNESFYGKKPNFTNITRYHELKSVLTELMNKARTIRKLDELPPERDHRSAIITMEYDTVVLLKGDLFPLFRKAVNLSDGVSLSICGDYPGISFTVDNVWEE